MSKLKPIVSIIILNLDGLSDTIYCLKSLKRHTNYPNYEIIVLDNGSKQNEARLLRNEFGKSIRVFRSNINKGYTGGNNWVLKKTKGKYVVLLNNDTQVEKNWLEPLVYVLEKNKKVAVVQPKIRMLTKKSYFDYAGATGGFIDKYGYPFTRGRVFDVQEKDKGQYDTNTRIFWASGSACVIRKSIIKKVGGLFSENLFNYMEEIDFCWRVWNRGYSVYYVHDSIIYHKGASTSKRNIVKKRFWEHRNNLFILTRNLDRNKLIKILIPRLILELFTYTGYLLRGEYKFLYSLFLSHLDYARKFIFIRYKRNRMPNKENLPIYQGSIVIDYFLKSNKTFRSLGWSSKGNITYLLYNTKSSGGVKLIFQQANKFMEKGYKVKICSLFGKKQNWFNLKIKVKGFPDLLTSFTPNILIATFWPTAFLSKFIKGQKHYYFVLDTPDFYASALFKKLIRISYKIKLKHIVISKYLKREIKKVNKNAKPILIHSSAINTKLYKPSASRSKKPNTRVKILSVMSRYEYYKGPDLLTNTVKKLKSNNSHYTFTLVSREKHPYENVFDTFYSNPSDKKLASLYQKSDVLLVTSRAEGLFLPGLEAMASGCLVVTTNSKGVLEYANNDNSIIVDNINDIWKKNVIKQVINDRERYKRLTINGLETAQKYSQENIIEDMEKAFFTV